MASQLELDLDPGEPRFSLDRAADRLRARAGTLALGLVVWSPVWLPLAVSLHLGFFGLRPALAEGARLDAATAEVERREAALADEAAVLEREQRMLADEIYRERLRRSRRQGLSGRTEGAVALEPAPDAGSPR